jgi:hypothetical protein
MCVMSLFSEFSDTKGALKTMEQKRAVLFCMKICRSGSYLCIFIFTSLFFRTGKGTGSYRGFIDFLGIGNKAETVSMSCRLGRGKIICHGNKKSFPIKHFIKSKLEILFTGFFHIML